MSSSGDVAGSFLAIRINSEDIVVSPSKIVGNNATISKVPPYVN